MKIRFLLSVFFMSLVFVVVLSDCTSLSVVLSFIIMPVMIYLSRGYKIFIFLLPFLWESFLLYPVYIVLLSEYNAVLSLLYFSAICVFLSAPLSFFIFLCLSKKYRAFAPFFYILILYLFRSEVFQTLPVILIFQNDVMRRVAGFSFSPWLTTISLLYLSLSIFEILMKDWLRALCYFFVSLLFLFFPVVSKYNADASGFKIAGVQLSLLMRDFTDLKEIINFTDKMIRDDPDIKMVVYSESPWLGFKNYNNSFFTKELISYFMRRSLTENVIYIFQVDSLDFSHDFINKVLTVKIENGMLWYSGKSHLVPGWERGPGENYFSPELNKKTFKVSGMNFKTLICYDALFMPSFFDRNYDVVIVQSNYGIFRVEAGKNAYEHMIKVSNILSWFSNASGRKSYINVQNDGGSDFINSDGVRNDYLYYESLWNKSVKAILRN